MGICVSAVWHSPADTFPLIAGKTAVFAEVCLKVVNEMHESGDYNKGIVVFAPTVAIVKQHFENLLAYDNAFNFNTMKMASSDKKLKR